MSATPPWPLSAAQIARLLGAEKLGFPDDGPPVRVFAYDSRRLPAAAAIFVALSGQRDGHDFAAQAYASGARAFMLTRPLDLPPDAAQIIVPDTLAALQRLAAYRRSLLRCPVVAITGSNGKTTVKEWLTTLLEPRWRVGKSPGSYNSQLGAALSLLHLPDDCELALIEAGISQSGEMARLEAMIQPTHGLFTHFGDAHDEGFPSREDKLREKLLLFRNVERLWLTADEALVNEETANLPAVRVGQQADGASDFLLTNAEENPDGWSFSLERGGHSWRFRLNVGGAAALENAALALAAALDLGVPPTVLQEAAPRLQAVSMRLTLITDNPEISLLNDAYNADADSVRNAFARLSRHADQPRRVVVLSDLEHQGERLADVQRALLQEALDQFGTGNVIGVGPVCLALRDELPGLSAWADVPQLVRELDYERFRFATVLLKGARAFALERLIPYLTLRPHAATLRVDFEALAHNWRNLRRRLPARTGVIAMLKAEAYGSGAWPLAQELTSLGASALMVASTAEALDLRRRGLKLPVIVQSADLSALELLEPYGLEPVISDWPLLETLSGLEKPPRVHLEIDSGMGRLGFLPEEVPALVMRLKSCGVNVITAFTHFSASEDAASDGYTREQARRFEAACERLRAYNSAIKLHACNSAGALRFPEYAYDFVRAGIVLYGLVTADGQDEALAGSGWRNVLSLLAPVLRVRTLPAETRVGYGSGCLLARETRVATLGAGYADGLPRCAGHGRWSVLLGGKLCPTLGSVCMDLMMVDVTAAPSVQAGDWAALVGDSEAGEPSWSALAELADTIPYELICHLGKRLSRRYVRED